MTMDNREAIIKSIEKIAQLSKQPGNKWLIEEFFKRFGLEETGSNSKLDEIYEYCIEKVLNEQAKDFYKDMPLKSIVSQLELDFVKMEHERRKNIFDEFALAVYQQIECLTNEVFRLTNLRDLASEMLKKPAYFRPAKQDDGRWELKRLGNFSIGNYLFGNERMKEIETNFDKEFLKYANEKIACVEYYICFDGKFQESESSYFKYYKDLYYSIYQFRNLNHRGGESTEYQKNIIKRIRPKQGLYYIKFYNALEFYVSKICNNLSNSLLIEVE